MSSLALYSAAVELIRQAIAPTGTVELRKPSAAGVSEDIRLRTAPGDRARSVQLKLFGGRSPESSPANEPSRVWIVANASPELLQRLRANAQNFVDVKRGVVRLVLPRLHIDRSNLEPPKIESAERTMLDPFGDRASLVARAIVQQPGRSWTTRALAEAAGVSTMTASHVVRQLSEIGALDVQRAGRANSVRLRSIRRLIERWALQYDWQRNARLSVEAPVGSIDRFLQRLPASLKGTRWALTLQAGASLVAPIAAWDRIHLYVDVDSDRALADTARGAGWPIGDGKVVLMRPWYAESVWFGLERRKGLPVVSELQLILDLWQYPVRGLEQAEHLLEHAERRMGIGERSANA
jgi:hypothetical protein